MLNYHEEKLDDVIRYFAKGLKPQDGSEVSSVEWFVDQVKGVVVFKIFTKDSGETTNA